MFLILMKDQTIGQIILSLLSIFFIYYTIWIIILPFFDKDHAFRNIFPDPYYAILFPVLLMVIMLSIVCTFMSLVMINARQSVSSM